jgi:diacylglycerol O-acyltransferase
LPPFWASGTAPASRAGKEPAPAPTMANAAEVAVAALSGQARSLPQLAAAFGKMLKRVGDHGDGMVLPFVDSPLSVLNGRVREKRRFATQHFTMERLRTLAKPPPGARSTTWCWRSAAARCAASWPSATPCPRRR